METMQLDPAKSATRMSGQIRDIQPKDWNRRNHRSQ